MNKQTRTYEEIITLQDKAIEALTQANAALVMALEAVKKARAEHGFTLQFPGIGNGFGNNAGSGVVNPTFIQPAYIPNTTDGIQWGQTTGLMTLTNSAGSQLAAKTITANSLIAQAQDQKALATAYVNAFQGLEAKKESDGVSQVSGCVSVS